VKNLISLIYLTTFLISSTAFSQNTEDSLLNLYHTSVQDTDKIIAIHQYIVLNYSIPDSAIKYAAIAIEIAKKNEEISLMAKSYNLLAISYYYKGDLIQSANNLNVSLTHYKKIRNKPGMASCYNGIGVVYYDQGKLYKALQLFIQSLRIKEKLDNKKSFAMTLNNVGNVYKDLKKIDKSLEYYNQSIKIKEEIEDFHGLAMTLNNIGLLYHNNREYEKAKEHYNQSLIMKRQIGDLHGEAMTLNNIGLSFEVEKDYRKALEYYQKSISIKEQIGDQYGLVMSMINTATVYREIGNYSKCYVYLLESEKIALEIGATTQLRDCYQRLYETYELQKKPHEALKYYKYYIAVKDSIMSENSYKNIEELQAQYGNKEKQLTIQNLTKKEALNKAQLAENRAVIARKNITTISLIIGLFISLVLIVLFFVNAKQRNKRNAALNKALQEKEVLFKEVHHRVKNNFQVISSLLNLHANNSENEAVQKALGEAKDRIGSMSLVHEKLYQSKDLTKIKMDEYVSQLIMHLNDSFDSQIEFASILKIENVYLDIETVIPLGLIFNELITNSIKYAFKGRTDNTIEIGIKKTDNKVEVKYRDNGIGLPQDFNLDNLDSLGLNLVQILVIQIQGTLAVNTDNGTRYSFDFKLTG
jgi:two-component system, sensor histidine kinase PdtaS